MPFGRDGHPITLHIIVSTASAISERASFRQCPQLRKVREEVRCGAMRHLMEIGNPSSKRATTRLLQFRTVALVLMAGVALITSGLGLYSTGIDHRISILINTSAPYTAPRELRNRGA